MKSINPLVALLMLAFLVPAGVSAQTAYKIKTSKLTIDGTSSLHDWTSEAKQLEWTGVFTVQDKKLVEVKDVQVKIPVKSIKSTKGGTMDDKTYEAFKSDKNPNITYKISSAKISGTGDFTLATTGALQMAGATQTISMTVTAKMLPNGDIQLTGSQKLNMKDYKMVPPTAVLGTIKVGPEVTIKFDLTLTAAK
jgi:polyisoprenoid-binding protein YceI